MITSEGDHCDTGGKTISSSVRAWWNRSGLSNFRETFFIVFSLPAVTVNTLCSCPDDARRRANNRRYFWHPPPIFTLLWRHPTVSMRVLALWLIKAADLSCDLKIFSLCLHLVILPAFVPDPKVMRADFLIGYCISGQTHTHELMKWLWTADRKIFCALGAQREGHSFFSWQETREGGVLTSLNKLKPALGVCTLRRRWA